jgi:cell wall-associated NlpC family hydrolase
MAGRCHHTRKRQTLALTTALIAGLLGAASATADPSIGAKQAEAQQVLAQINQLDLSVERAAEAYNLANIKLGGIQHELTVNTHDLHVAKKNLEISQKALSARLVQLYENGDSTSTLSVLLGATSLDDLVNRLDVTSRVSGQDAKVVRQVIAFRTAVRVRQQRLVSAREEQRRVVAQRAAAKASAMQQLTERQRLLASVKSEIAHMMAVERSRQLALAAAARARLSHTSTNQTALSYAVGASGYTPEGASVVPPSQYSGVVGVAMQYLGTPYVWAGASPAGFDCSGFTSYVYAQVGVSLPHNAAAQYGYGTPVPYDQLQPGDLVFFDGLGHVGLYIGGGEFIHAPHTGDVVKISSLAEYAGGYVGARRI